MTRAQQLDSRGITNPAEPVIHRFCGQSLALFVDQRGATVDDSPFVCVGVDVCGASYTGNGDAISLLHAPKPANQHIHTTYYVRLFLLICSFFLLIEGRVCTVLRKLFLLFFPHHDRLWYT